MSLKSKIYKCKFIAKYDFGLTFTKLYREVHDLYYFFIKWKNGYINLF